MTAANLGENGHLGGNAKEQLKAFIERVERLEEEKKALADDIKDVFGEAKVNGFDVVTMRKIVRLRKMDKAERDQAQAILDTYMFALGMLADLPGKSAGANAELSAAEKKRRGKAGEAGEE